jgi:metal-responsive CopG/Arc/MetJ family transcriptional regulator
MEIKGYKEKREKKTIIQPCRMDEKMLSKLNEITAKTGISVSELIRESIRQLIIEVEETGQVSFRFR